MSEPRVGVYMLDVGQGDCTFVVGPRDAAPVLFDCPDAYVAERFVKDHGITRLSAAIASHLDRDHVGGFLPFLHAFRALHGPSSVEAFYVNADKKPDPELRRAAYALLEQAIEWDRQGEVPLYGSFREGTTKRVCGG
jgi:beta-lactamase superfamily II metal-dependent hydrolase